MHVGRQGVSLTHVFISLVLLSLSLSLLFLILASSCHIFCFQVSSASELEAKSPGPADGACVPFLCPTASLTHVARLQTKRHAT